MNSIRNEALSDGLSNIPEELRSRSQWVTWKSEKRDGKDTKVPYIASGVGKASSTDSTTWRTFEEAVQALETGRYSGIGFVFSSGDPYAGVDLDKCRNPETGDLEEWAAKIVADLGGYAEASPSGTGVHIIIRGKAPNKKRGKVEAYSSERYFTVTGEALSPPPHDVSISGRQKELDALTRKYLIDSLPGPTAANNRPAMPPPDGPSPKLTDEEVIALCRRAGNAAKFSDLFDAGDLTFYKGDDSRADLGLLGILKFYTQDPEQLERLFSDSAIGCRKKWRDREDYRHGTIEEALEEVTETYTPPRNRNRNLSNKVGSCDPERKIQAFSFSGREKPAPRGWIVDNFLWSGHATSWFGEGGVAKSLLALHLGLTVAAESRSYWMAFKVKTVPVLYLDFELDADEQHRRALDLAKGMGLKTIPENFYYLSVAMLPPEQAFRVAAEECRRLNIELAIVDSVGFALDGDSENARDVLGFYRERIQPLKDAGASPLLIDHQAKIIKGEKYSDKQAFGSVYKTNAVRSAFQIRGSSEQGEITATFTHKKNNFGWKERDFSLNIVFEEGCTTVSRLDAAIPNPDRKPPKKELVLDAFEELGRCTIGTVAQKTGIPLQTVRNSVAELSKEDALIDTGEKQKGSRIFTTPNHTTKVAVAVAEAQAVTRPLEEHPSAPKEAPRLTEKQAQEAQKLMDSGTPAAAARAAVLGEGA